MLVCVSGVSKDHPCWRRLFEPLRDEIWSQMDKEVTESSGLQLERPRLDLTIGNLRILRILERQRAIEWRFRDENRFLERQQIYYAYLLSLAYYASLRNTFAHCWVRALGQHL